MRWRVVLAIWTGYAILYGGQTVLSYVNKDHAIVWNDVALRMLGIYTWAPLTPVILWIARRSPFGKKSVIHNVLWHGPGIVFVVLVDSGVFFAMDQLIFHVTHLSPQVNPSAAAMPVLQRFLRLLSETFPFSVFYYGGVVAVGQAFDYRARLQERELQSTQLEARLAQAQLQVLRAQLQPHFLFNTLHSISALIQDDPKAADRMITHLSDLLRLNLAKRDQEVTLKEELEILNPYIQIEQIRFQDRLTVRQEIDAVTLDALVPNLLLQPLVENAVKHGISPRAGAGRINIHARRRDGRLSLEIADNGVGMPAGEAAAKEGVGLGNTRARLRQLYGAGHRFELRNQPSGGLLVSIDIPFRTASTPSRSSLVS